MKKLKRPRSIIPSFLQSRWTTVGALLLIVVAGVWAYIWWSRNSWDAYESRYTSAYQDINTRLTSVFSLQSDTTQQRSEKITSLAKLSADVAGMNDTLCRQNSLIGWQQKVFNEYKTHEESCRATVATIGAFGSRLNLAVEYLRQEQALALLLAAAPSKNEVAEGDFEGQLTAWRSVHEAVKSATSSGDFDPVRQAALDATSAVVKDWEEVIAAHQVKDKARYMKAVQALAAGYDGLQAVTSINNVQLTGIASSLKEAYQKL